MRSNYDKHTTNDIHSQMENSLTFNVLRLEDDHEVKLWWTHN